MQGGTPERRKRWLSGWQTLHISDPKLILCLYCVEKNVGGFTTTVLGWEVFDIFFR